MKKIMTRFNKRPCELYAKVSDEDAKFLAGFSWSVLQLPSGRGMCCRTRLTVEGHDKTIFMHQMVVLLTRLEPLMLADKLKLAEELADMLAFIGKIRHLDGDRLNNQRENLVCGGLTLGAIEQQEANEQVARHSEGQAASSIPAVTPEESGKLGSELGDML